MIEQLQETGWLVAAVLGGLLLVASGWALVWRRRLVALAGARAEGEAATRRLEQELAHSDAQLDASRERLEATEAALAAAREQLAERRERCARLETERDQLASRHREQLALLEEARAGLKEEFHQLAGRIFEDRQRAFSAQSRDSLEALLRPFREQVDQSPGRGAARPGAAGARFAQGPARAVGRAQCPPGRRGQ